MSKKMSAVKPTVTVSTTYGKGSKPSDVENAYESKKPTLTLSKEYSKGSSPEEVKKGYEGQSVSMKLNLTTDTSYLTTTGKNIFEGFKTAMQTQKWKFTGGDAGTWKIEAKAMGGVVRSADLFMANENGRSELIGRLGNQTGVANQEQMVEAMARGVGYANAEQNALLREQNGLLMRILQKDNSVRLGASAALGRVAKQSIAMYGMATGG